MLKGVNRRVVEISLNDSDCFEKALLYVKPTYALPLGEKAQETVEGLYPKKDRSRPYRRITAVLAVCLGLTLSAFAILLILYIKIA